MQWQICDYSSLSLIRLTMVLLPFKKMSNMTLTTQLESDDDDQVSVQEGCTVDPKKSQLKCWPTVLI